jgi:hypothetical protein
MACGCLHQINKQLKPSGFFLEQNVLAGPSMARVKIALGATGKKRPPVLYADFCPFCGKAYQEEVEEQEKAP